MAAFDQAVARWTANAASGSQDPLNANDFFTIRDSLAKEARKKALSLSLHQVSDVVDEAIARMARALKTGAVDADKSPSGYLIVVLNSALADHFRKTTDHLSLDSVVMEGDDAIARLLDDLVDAALVRRALCRAAARRDMTAVKVVTAWLDLAAQNGNPPRSRDVAAVAQVSKTAVNDALRRYRADLDHVMREDAS